MSSVYAKVFNSLEELLYLELKNNKQQKRSKVEQKGKKIPNAYFSVNTYLSKKINSQFKTKYIPKTSVTL